MAEKNRYPQIPSTVWWGVRAILQRTPNATINERLLAIQLEVQETAAKAYIFELKAVGIINEDGKATPLALKWRMDETYAEAVDELVSKAYPEELVHIAPPGGADRQKVVSWFQHEGFGQGAAGNKTATYLLLSSPTPNDAPSRTSGKAPQAETAARKRMPAQPRGKATLPSNSTVMQNPQRGGDGQETSKSKSPPESFPLNVNVQIHISADAGTEQIESIFKAMRRYLYDAPSS